MNIATPGSGSEQTRGSERSLGDGEYINQNNGIAHARSVSANTDMVMGITHLFPDSLVWYIGSVSGNKKIR